MVIEKKVLKMKAILWEMIILDTCRVRKSPKNQTHTLRRLGDGGDSRAYRKSSNI